MGHAEVFAEDAGGDGLDLGGVGKRPQGIAETQQVGLAFLAAAQVSGRLPCGVDIGSDGHCAGDLAAVIPEGHGGDTDPPLVVRPSSR